MAAKRVKAKKDVPYIKIGYIGGGSRGWAPQMMVDLAASDEMQGEIRLYDLDRPSALLNARWGKKVMESPEALSQWKYKVVDSLKEALTDVDFVVASIQPGPIWMMGHDINIPAKYGILHPVGDTVGPAGLVRSLRSVPDYAAIARAVERYCPSAWVINYTNPMSVCTRTLFKVFPQIKAFGCCHEMFGTQGYLCKLLDKYHGIKGKTRYDLKVTALGVNHFVWLLAAEYEGIDLVELYAKEWREPGKVRKIGPEEIAKMNVFENRGQVGYDLFKRFGIMPTGGERHLVEFVPWYLKDEETLKRWGVQLTPYSFRAQRYEALPRERRAKIADRAPAKIKMSGEETVQQMLALLGLHDLRTNVNLPNIGQAEGLPHEAVVETFAYFTHDRVEPEFAGRLPAGVEALVARTIYNQEMTVEAGLTCDYNLAFQTLLNDPLTNLTTDRAEKMFKEMLRATKDCLPGWKV